MVKQPTVTCIIPCHNNADTILAAIESAIDQCDWVVVVYDECTDDSIMTVNEIYGLTHDKLLWEYTAIELPSIRAGVCHARNTGIVRSLSDLLIPLDADDTLVDGAVQTLRDAWKPGHFVYGNWYEVKDDKQVEHKPPPISMIRQKNIGYASFMFHKEDWQAAGGYLPHFNIGGEHWAFMAALIYRAKVKPIYIDTPIFHYNRHAGKRYNRANTYHSTIQAMVGEVIDGRT